MAVNEHLVVEGLRDLQRALKAAEGTLDKDFKREIKTVGGIVQKEAKALAQANGLMRTGALIRGIKLSVTQTGAAIYETASRESKQVTRKRVRSMKGVRGGSRYVATGSKTVNYPYPIIYEFGGRSAGHRFDKTAKVNNRSAIGKRLAASGAAQGSRGQYGPRAFMYPALERRAADVVQGFEGVLDNLANGFDKGSAA